MLLDEAVGTPAPLLRSAGKKTSSASRRAAGCTCAFSTILKETYFQPVTRFMKPIEHTTFVYVAVGSRLETSASMLGLSLTPGRSLLATPGSSVVVSLQLDCFCHRSWFASVATFCLSLFRETKAKCMFFQGSLGESVMEGATTPSARFLSVSTLLERGSTLFTRLPFSSKNQTFFRTTCLILGESQIGNNRHHHNKRGAFVGGRSCHCRFVVFWRYNLIAGKLCRKSAQSQFC